MTAQVQAKLWHVAQKQLAGNRSQRSGPHDQRSRSASGTWGHSPAARRYLPRTGHDRQSGTPEKPITIRAAEGESVTLTGADRITDWSLIPGDDRVYSTPWPHKFVAWNKSFTHPNDDYHRLIGRCEQVFINGYPLRQVLERDKLSRGTFFADIEAQRLYLQPAGNQDITKDKAMVEASTREQILRVKGSYVIVKGIRFRYAANRAQQGAVQFAGDHITVEDCIFEYTNASGAAFTGKDIVVRNCTFQHNGQLGFGASHAHGLLLTGCTVRNNNTKGFDRGWEAGGDKICLTRGAVLENSVFTDNRGNGIWFDIGNEDCEVRNCLIANNEDAGIFYEISYGLHAHDNVIVGNGLAFTPGAWGAAAGISLSSSPGCTIERNLILGNKEGFNFREQSRSTPRIDNRKSEPVWNHDQTIRHNVLAFNRDAQVWGWFDVSDERHWPKSHRSDAARRFFRSPCGGIRTCPCGHTTSAAVAGETSSSTSRAISTAPTPGQDLFNWGVTWKKHKRYANLDELRQDLSVDQRWRRRRVPRPGLLGPRSPRPGGQPRRQNGLLSTRHGPGCPAGDVQTCRPKPGSTAAPGCEPIVLQPQRAEDRRPEAADWRP